MLERFDEGIGLLGSFVGVGTLCMSIISLVVRIVSESPVIVSGVYGVTAGLFLINSAYLFVHSLSSYMLENKRSALSFTGLSALSATCFVLFTVLSLMKIMG